MVEDRVSNTEHVASMVSGNASGNSISAVKVLAYRIPIFLLGPVDAMASKACKSRNAMLNLLLRVGIDEVRKQLTDEVAETLTVVESKAYSELLGDGSPSETLEE